jgi:hypothetical protein
MPDAPSHRPDEPNAEDGSSALHAVRTYPPEERPDVLVKVGEEWHPGELQQWLRDRAGQWWAHVAWGRSPEATSVETFPADRVWEDAVATHPANA